MKDELVINRKDAQLLAEALAEKIVDLGADIHSKELTIKLIKQNTGFYDNATDKLSHQIADLDKEREDFTEVFLRLHKFLNGIL